MKKNKLKKIFFTFLDLIIMTSKNASSGYPAPTVLWSQNMTCVRLTIKLLDISKESVEMSLDSEGMFRCQLLGTGTLGSKTRYAFTIPLDHEIFNKQPIAKLHNKL